MPPNPPIKNKARKSKFGKRSCLGTNGDGDQCTTEVYKMFCCVHAKQLNLLSDKTATAIFKLHNMNCKPESWEDAYTKINKINDTRLKKEAAKILDELDEEAAEAAAAVDDPMGQGV